MTINERIKQVIFFAKIKENDLAKQIGVTRQVLNNVTNGHNKPSNDTITAILKHFPDLNARWFLTGDGDMWTAGAPGTVNQNGHINVAGNNNGNITIAECMRENEHLRQRLKDKEEMIELLKKKQE